MVLCGVEVKADGSEVVELLTPPADAKPGDRIYVTSLSNTPLTVNQCDKKKAFEKVSIDLKLVSGIAYWTDLLLTTENGGQVTSATIKDGAIR